MWTSILPGRRCDDCSGWRGWWGWKSEGLLVGTMAPGWGGGGPEGEGWGMLPWRALSAAWCSGWRCRWVWEWAWVWVWAWVGGPSPGPPPKLALDTPAKPAPAICSLSMGSLTRDILSAANRSAVNLSTEDECSLRWGPGGISPGTQCTSTHACAEHNVCTHCAPHNGSKTKPPALYTTKSITVVTPNPNYPIIGQSVWIYRGFNLHNISQVGPKKWFP